MFENSKSIEHFARCPRCGYDLRGAIDTWTDSCPLISTCSECGLEFIWSEVLCPEKYEPLWCVEFSRSGWFPISSLKTVCMSFRPWRYWRELKMSHEIHWRRIYSFLALLFLPWIMLYVIEQGALATRVWYYVNQQVAISVQQTASNLAQYRQYVADAETSGNYSEYELQRLRDSFLQVQAASKQTPVLNQSLAMAIYEAIFMPIGSSSSGFISNGRWADPYPAPNELHEYVIQIYMINTRITANLTADFELLIGLLILILPQFFGIPLGFLLLPVSRRCAKIQWRHIGRVTIHSFALPFVIVYPGSIMIAIVTFVPSMMRFDLTVCILLNTILWSSLLVWWIFAIKNFLKIPHGWLVAPLLAFLTLLLYLLALTVVLSMWIHWSP